MEILKLEVSALWDYLKLIIIITVAVGIIDVVTKSKIKSSEKYLSIFKICFYLLLASLTLILNVNVDGDNIDFFMEIPKELTVGQMLVIIISILEVGSNLVTVFTLPRSEYHLMSKEDFRKFQSEQNLEITKMRLRLAKLEKIEEVKE